MSRIKYLTPKVSEELAEKARSLANMNNEDIVDITRLASFFDCEVEEVEFEGTEEDVSGIIKFDDEKQKFFIQINKNDSEPRKRFTIAHELSHRLLHDEKIKQGEQFIEYRRANYYYEAEELKNEIQANMLAASLLMPEKKFKRVYEEVSDIESLATYFVVSKQAALIRLQNLNILQDE